VLPLAWQPDMAQLDCMIGLTSAANALLVTVLQFTVKGGLLFVFSLLQAVPTDAATPAYANSISIFFINAVVWCFVAGVRLNNV
jgi:hypothetical protein